jgi:hypothetical protein
LNETVFFAAHSSDFVVFLSKSRSPVAGSGEVTFRSDMLQRKVMFAAITISGTYLVVHNRDHRNPDLQKRIRPLLDEIRAMAPHRAQVP